MNQWDRDVSVCVCAVGSHAVNFSKWKFHHSLSIYRQQKLSAYFSTFCLHLKRYFVYEANTKSKFLPLMGHFSIKKERLRKLPKNLRRSCDFCGHELFYSTKGAQCTWGSITYFHLKTNSENQVHFHQIEITLELVDSLTRQFAKKHQQNININSDLKINNLLIGKKLVNHFKILQFWVICIHNINMFFYS